MENSWKLHQSKRKKRRKRMEKSLQELFLRELML